MPSSIDFNKYYAIVGEDQKKKEKHIKQIF